MVSGSYANIGFLGSARAKKHRTVCVVRKDAPGTAESSTIDVFASRFKRAAGIPFRPTVSAEAAGALVASRPGASRPGPGIKSAFDIDSLDGLRNES